MTRFPNISVREVVGEGQHQHRQRHPSIKKTMNEDLIRSMVLQIMGEREGSWAEEFQKGSCLNMPPP